AYAFEWASAPTALSIALLLIAWIIITIAFYRHNFFEDKAKLARQIGNVFCSIFVALVFIAGWLYLRPKPAQESRATSTQAQPSPSTTKPDRPKTLRELYESDFRSTSRPAIVGRPVTFTLKAHPQQPVNCDTKVIVDIETKTRIVAYYIPITAFTREICEVISDDYQNRLTEWDEYGIRLTPEGERPNELKRFKDAAFTGQIYVYHESLLYQPELDELSILYRKKALDPHFRGIDYAAATNKPQSQ
ncbi:MAG: hypothetical protein HYZ48_01205, partial [Chlamydiales bacterium]|nr:hypothetical protein [Chlamydiales bacterium]